MKSILTRCCSKFILSYVEGLNVFKKKYQKTREIKVGDYVLYSSINKESKTPMNSYINVSLAIAMIIKIQGLKFAVPNAFINY